MQRLLGLVEQGRTVLAPTAEIAAGILDRIEQSYLAAGLTVWPTPQVRDFSGWAHQQYDLQCFARPEASRVLEDIEERQLWREVIADSAIAAEFADLAGAARSARLALRAMHDHGIPVAALQSYPSIETNALLQWSETFDERCRQLHALSRDRIPHLLQATLERPVPIESPSWRPSALAWLKVHADDSLAPMCAVADKDPAMRRAPSMRVFKSFDDEVAAVAQWSRSSRLSDPQARHWVCVAGLAAKRTQVCNAFDAALAPTRLSMHEFSQTPPYAIAGGTALADFEPVRMALACLAAMSASLSFERFSSLLRAPALQGSEADASVAARVDRSLRVQGPNEAPLLRWIALASKIASGIQSDGLHATSRLQSMHRGLSASPAPLLLSQWASLWIQALEVGPWMQRAHWSGAAYQAAERLRELIGSLARADAVFGPLRLPTAVRALSTAARETMFQPQTGQTPVWITGYAVDPWLSYSGIWITGLSAQAWPPPPSPLPLLPVQLQRQYGVPASGAALQLHRAVDLQSRWLARASDAVFSCSSDPDSHALPSPLLARDFSPQVEAGILSEPLWRSLALPAPTLQSCTDSAGPRFTPAESTRGTTSLREQSRCPFRGFAVTRLRADPLEFPRPGFSDRERGVILHESLQAIWEKLQSSAELARLDPTQILSLVRAGVDRAVNAAVNKRDPGPHWSLRETRRLLRLLPHWLALETRREPFEVRELETVHQFNAAQLNFEVRVDRVDGLKDGSLVLIDYKSGTVQTDWLGERPQNPQLPIYALSVNGPVTALAYGRVSSGECRFMGVSERADILPQVNAKTLEGLGMSGQLILWADRLALLAGELSNGDARVKPSKNACRNCTLPAFCRIAEQPDAVADADDPEGGEHAL